MFLTWRNTFLVALTLSGVNFMVKNLTKTLANSFVSPQIQCLVVLVAILLLLIYHDNSQYKGVFFTVLAIFCGVYSKLLLSV